MNSPKDKSEVKPADRVKYKSTKLQTFEFRLLQTLQRLGVIGDANVRILVACSGGLDSVALLTALHQMASRGALQLEVAYTHHGPQSGHKHDSYRDRAASQVREMCAQMEVPFHLIKFTATAAVKELISEADMRLFRLGALRAQALESNCSWIALAHHADDLLETRLIRLIRGTGAQGIAAMREVSEGRDFRLLRPLLSERRAELMLYARARGLRWCEDPSNKDDSPLRNWIRNQWLPELEKKRPGGVTSLMRSLTNLAELGPLPGPLPGLALGSEQMMVEQIILREEYGLLGDMQRRQRIAGVFSALGLRDFTSGHVLEVQKRLASARKSHRFDVLGVEWLINAQQISATVRQRAST